MSAEVLRLRVPAAEAGLPPRLAPATGGAARAEPREPAPRGGDGGLRGAGARRAARPARARRRRARERAEQAALSSHVPRRGPPGRRLRRAAAARAPRSRELRSARALAGVLALEAAPSLAASRCASPPRLSPRAAPRARASLDSPPFGGPHGRRAGSRPDRRRAAHRAAGRRPASGRSRSTAPRIPSRCSRPWRAPPAEDAGLGAAASRTPSTRIGLVDSLGWYPTNGPRLLAERLGAQPRRELVTGVGGETPLVLVNHVARAIARGEIDVALLGGTHVIRTPAHARGRRACTSTSPSAARARRPPSPRASRAIRRARSATASCSLRRSTRSSRTRCARGAGWISRSTGGAWAALMEPFTRVAAANPHAWFPVARSADELAKPSAENRMIAFPYPKYLNAVIETDQAAALLLCSASAARRLGVAGGAHGPLVGRRPGRRGSLVRHRAAGLRGVPGAAPRGAARRSPRRGVALGDVGLLDLYSCFPVAVEMACEELGLAEDDPRGLSVTGGLPYAGRARQRLLPPRPRGDGGAAARARRRGPRDGERLVPHQALGDCVVAARPRDGRASGSRAAGGRAGRRRRPWPSPRRRRARHRSRPTP